MDRGKRELISGLRQAARLLNASADTLETGRDGKRIKDVSPVMCIAAMQWTIGMLGDPQATQFLKHEEEGK